MYGVQLTQNEVSAEQMLQTVAKYVKQTELAKRMGLKVQQLNIYMHGAIVPTKHYESLNAVVCQIGEELNAMRIENENTLEQLKSLGKWVNLPWLMQKELGLTVRQTKMRMSDKREKVYGQFTPEMLRTINAALIRASFELLQIKVVAPIQDNIDNKVETYATVQDSSKE